MSERKRLNTKPENNRKQRADNKISLWVLYLNLQVFQNISKVTR